MADSDKPKSTEVLQKVVDALPNAKPPVRPYLLIVVLAALLTVIMPSLPSSFTFRERVGVIFSAVVAVIAVLFLGLIYEWMMLKFFLLQQRLEVIKYDQQAATFFPREVNIRPPTSSFR
jgi:hypothetical protein